MQPDPEDEKGRPAQAANSETVVDETSLIVSAFDALVVAVQPQYLGRLMHCTAADAAKLLLRESLTPSPWADATSEIIYRAIVHLVGCGLDPDPRVVADRIRRQRSDLPSFILGELVVRVFELYGTAPTAEMASWHQTTVEEYTAVEKLRAACRTVQDRCGVGELADLLELAETTILPALDAAKALVA